MEENTAHNSSEENFEALIKYIDDLVKNDFNQLLRILYRVDISEEKLKKRIAENKDVHLSSAEIIAKLLVEREQ